MSRPALIAASLAWSVSSCVPFVGKRSELVLKAQPPAQEERTVARDFQPFVGGEYKGELKGGWPDGQGTFVFARGGSYTGQFRAGEFHGQGTLTLPDGRSIEGTFHDGADPDAGTIVYPDGGRFEGAIARRRASGEGTLRRPDGSELSGTFKKDRVEGVGVSIDASGASFWGPFEKGSPHGRGVCSSPEGAQLCDKNKGVDVTADVVAAEIARRTEEALTADVRQAAAELATSTSTAESRVTNDISARQRRKRRLKGPGQDDTCSCCWHGFCGPAIIMRTDERARECEGRVDECRAEDAIWAKERERERATLCATCRKAYAEWESVQGTPALDQLTQQLDAEIVQLQAELARVRADAARRKRELDELERQRLADEAERRRLNAVFDQRVRAERQKELERLEESCKKQRRGRHCSCGAVMPVPKPGGVCPQ